MNSEYEERNSTYNSVLKYMKQSQISSQRSHTRQSSRSISSVKSKEVVNNIKSNILWF